MQSETHMAPMNKLQNTGLQILQRNNQQFNIDNINYDMINAGLIDGDVVHDQTRRLDLYR